MTAVSETALGHHDEVAPTTRMLAAVPARLEREAAAIELRQSFCAELKAERERRGISVQAIAEATKISGTLFADLERCDVSRWPAGIYRRAFFREYVGLIGLPADSTVSEFTRLFPDEVARASTEAASVPGPLRLTMARHSWQQFSPAHARAAAVDATIVLLVSGALAGLTAIGWWTCVGIVALCYHTMGTAILGNSPGTWASHRGVRRPSKGPRLDR